VETHSFAKVACAVLIAASLQAGEATVPSAPQTAAPAQTVAAAAVGGAASSLRAGSKKGVPAAAKLAPLAGSSTTAGPFTLIGSLTTPHPPVSIALNGNLAYACTPDEIVTVDITNPANPQTLAVATTPLINNSADINCSVQRGVLAVFADQVNSSIGDTPGFVAFSLANPQNPQVIQETPIDKRFFETPIYIDSYAFVPTGAITYGDYFTGQFGDLLSFDLSNFSAPVLLGTLATPMVNPVLGGAHLILGASQAGNRLLYLGGSTATGGWPESSNGVGQIHTVDVSNPTAMTVVSELALPQTVYLDAPLIQGTLGVAIGNTGGYASSGYPPTCCTGNIVVVTLDLSDQRSPVVRNAAITAFTSGSGGGGARIGNNQFLVAGVNDQTGTNVLLLIDTTNPNAPAFTTYPLAAPFNSMYASGNLLYVAASNGFLIYSIPGGPLPANPCPASIDAAVVIDPSGAFAGSLLADVKSAADHFLDTLQYPPDRAAVVKAGASATLLQGLTSSEALATSAINGIGPGTGSFIGAAITAAQQELLGPDTNPSAGHTIILFSDGSDAAAPASNSTALAAAAAKAAGIRIIAIGYGSTASKLTALASSATDAYAAVDPTTLQPVTVIDATTAMAVLKIDPQAAPGPRTCNVATGLQAISMPSAFTVQPATATTTAGNTVTLTSVTPGSGGAGAAISLAFNGLVGAELSAPQVRITLSPVNVGSATIVVTGSTWQSTATGHIIGFNIPQTLRPTAPVAYQLGVTGTTSTGLAFASVNTLPLTVTPSAGLAGAAPTAAARGAAVNVRLYVQGTSLSGASVQANFGDGIRVGSGAPGEFGQVAVNSANVASALVRIDVDAAVGPRTVALSANGTLYTLDNAFAVLAEYGPAQPVTLVSITPQQGPSGSTFTLSVTGLPAGQVLPQDVQVTLADPDIWSWYLPTVQVTSVSSSGGVGQIVFIATSNIDYDTGYYSVSLSGATTSYVPFQSVNTLNLTITPGLTVSDLGDLFVGTTTTVLAHGAGTHFVQGQTMAQFGPGISVGGGPVGGWGPVTVMGPADLSASLQIATNAPVGVRSITIKTGSELASGYATVVGPVISGIYPSDGNPGESLQVSLIGQNTHFVAGVSMASFGANISVGGAAAGQPGPITVTDSVTAAASIQIAAGAAVGSNDVTVTTGSEIAVGQGGFTVDIPCFEIYPNPLPRGVTTSVDISPCWTEEGEGPPTTVFQAGAQVNLGPDIQVGNAASGAWAPITVVDGEDAVAMVTVSPTAQLGDRTVSLQNGADNLQTDLWIQDVGTIVSVTPSSATAGTTVTLTIQTSGIELIAGQTQMQFLDGVVAGTPSVTAPNTLTITLQILPGYPEGPLQAAIYTPNGYVDWSTLLWISNPQPWVQNVTPSDAWPGQTVTVTAQLVKLTPVAGQTFASLGAGISVANAPLGQFGPVTVIAPDQIQFTAIVSPAAAAGIRTLVVKVGTQQAEGTFDVYQN
jgi:hypothetical protein